MKRYRPPLPLLILAWFTFLALACNLSTESLPPTIVPLPTDTPLPTIAYATLDPGQLPAPQVSTDPLKTTTEDMESLLNLVDPDRLMSHVDALQNFQTRHVNSPNQPNSGIVAAYEYIKAQFDSIKDISNGDFQITPIPFILEWNGLQTQQYNLVGIIPGKEIGGGIIVLGAHYDSVSLDWMDGSSYAPGANDNGSGVAALIELARILATRPHRASIMLVAFSAEEVGRQGSKAFVRYLQDRNISPDAMFSLDIIGSSTGPNGEIVDNQIRLFSVGPNDGPEMSASRELARAVQFSNITYNPTMQVILEDAQDRLGRYSDHMSFNDAGYAAVRFIEPLEDLKRQHTPNDRVEDVQPEYLARSTRTILTAVTSLADGPPPPKQLVLRSNEQGTRTLVWEPSPSASTYRIALRRPGGLSFVPSETFSWTGNSVDWEGFVPSLFAGVTVFAVDANGLMGPPSKELIIP